MKHSYLIYRQEKIDPTNLTIVRAETSDTVKTDGDLVQAIRKAVNKWLATGDEGAKALYDYAGDDMNIGDLYEYADNIVAHSDSILSLSFESIDRPDNWTYDTSLCDEVETTTPSSESTS